jgi:hypothetical protein
VQSGPELFTGGSHIPLFTRRRAALRNFWCHLGKGGTIYLHQAFSWLQLRSGSSKTRHCTFYNKHALQKQVAKDLLKPLLVDKANAATCMLALGIVAPRLDGPDVHDRGKQILIERRDSSSWCDDSESRCLRTGALLYMKR